MGRGRQELVAGAMRKFTGVAFPQPPPAWTDSLISDLKRAFGWGGEQGARELKIYGTWETKAQLVLFLILEIKASSSLRAVLVWAEAPEGSEGLASLG